MSIKATRNEYLIAQRHCLDAIEDFRSTTSVKEWLHRHTVLYNKVAIAPAGLPAIVDSHFGGEKFEEIQKFGYLYQTVKSVF
ncbi:MAG: hypothetical protein ACK5G0_01065 [Bacteroidota bacterium]|jgi:hypothetical protein